MLYYLPLDIYSNIVQCLLPDEFPQLYIACDNKIIQEYLKQHCVIICKTIITDELVEWFEQNGVKVQLLRECVKISSDEKYLTNGKLHSVNDEPAFIFTRFEMGGPFTVIKINIKAWYQNGLQHRDNGPAVIRSDGQVMYFQHGKQIR